MKKILSLILSLMVIVSMLPVSAMADENIILAGDELLSPIEDAVEAEEEVEDPTKTEDAEAEESSADTEEPIPAEAPAETEPPEETAAPEVTESPAEEEEEILIAETEKESEALFASSGTCGDNLIWTYENRVLTISGEGDMQNYDDEPPPWRNWSFETLVIDVGVTSVGDHAFLDCHNILNIEFASSITSIGDSAFCYCENLTDITIPSSVTTIGDWAFYSCFSLESVTIPDSVTTIGDYAFQGCLSLATITVGDKNTVYADIDGVLFNKTCAELVCYPCARSGSYIIPSSVTTIGDWAFFCCENLTSVTIPDSVTTIGDLAFDFCTSLESVTIPDSVTYIGDHAFYSCDSLESVTVPDSVTTIGDYAFQACSSLATITVGDKNTVYADIDGVLFNKTCAELVCYPCARSGSYIIPDSVTTIGDSAFDSCTSLESVTIPDSVTYIEDHAFYSCDSLTDVYYGGSEAQWNEIEIENGNDCLTKATIHYNREDSITGLSNVSLDKNSVAFYLYDVATKRPVSGVAITAGDATAKTGEDGIAVLSVYGNQTVTLSKESYTPQTLEQDFVPGNVYILSMTPTADSPTIFSATIRKGTGAEQNILTQKYYLEEGSSTQYTLTTYAGYDGGIKEYRLIQGGSVVETSADGVFSVSAQDFSVEQAIYLLAVGADGKYGDLRKTNLIVQDNAIKQGEYDYSLKLGNEISFEVDSSIPLIGGQEISVDLSDLPLYIETDGDKVKVAVNFLSASGSSSGGDTEWEAGSVFSDDIWKKFEESVDKNMDPQSFYDEYLSDAVWLSVGQGKPMSVGASTSLDFDIWGYLEGSVSSGSLSGTIKMTLDASVSNEWQASVGPVPVVITLKISGTLDGTLKASLYTTTWEEASITGTVSPSVSIDAGAGPGFAKVASLTINGKGTLGYTATWNGNAGRSDLLSLTAKLYLKLKVLFAEYKKDIAEKTWLLYESATAPTALSAISEADVLMAAMDVDNYSVANRDYLADTSPWMGEVSTWGVARSTTQSAKLLQSSIYEDTQLQIVQAGDMVMAFFLTDDPLRADVDRTMLVYTVYDAETDTWSEPQAVEDDGTADFYPSASVSDGTIYVVWSDMKEAVGEVETLDTEAIVGGIEITAAKYENGVFTTETITDDSCMDTTPALRGDFVVWVKSKTNNMLGNDDSSVLCLYNGERITELKNTANVVELDIGSLGGTICIALVTDGDGDYSTMTDRTMSLLDTAGNTLQTISEGGVAEISFTEDGLCWYEDGYLRCLESTGGTSVAWMGLESIIPGPWQIAEANGKTYLLFLGNVADEANSQTDIELFAYIYDGGSWSNAVQLTELGLSIQNFEAYVVNDTVGALLTISEMDTSGEETTETVSLCAVTVIENTNYMLAGFECEDVVATSDGYALDFTAVTANIGSGDGNGYSLELQYDGETVSARSFEGLAAGESAEIEGTFVLESLPAREGTYTIYLNADDTDYSDNSKDVMLGLDDLTVEFIDYSISDDFYAMSLTVKNNGLYDTDAVLNVCLGGKEGEVLLSEDASISAANSDSFLVTINTKDIEFADDSLPIWFVVSSGHKDSFAADNEDFFIVYRPDEYAEHTDHVAEVTEGVAPTCTVNGFAEGSHCGICGEVLVEQEAISATGHNYESSVTASSCTEQGYTTHVCSYCGDSYVDSYAPAGHTWDSGVITKEPTKEQDGEITYTCFVCGETIIETLSREVGDVTGDGDINVQDLVRLMKYIAGMDVEVIESECDTNHDDKIDILDVIRLIKTLA